MTVLFSIDYNYGTQAKLKGWVSVNGKRKEAVRMISRFGEHSGIEQKKEEIRKELLGEKA